jgi:serine/threonine protein kinase
LTEKDPEHTQVLPATPVATGASPALRVEQVPPGHRIGEYVVQSRIDAGGGGTVYIAESLHPPSRRVAIKVLLRELAASPLALSRFQREAEVVRLIDHPNIASVLESGELPDGRPYIVMELVSTENLKDVLERRGRLTPPELLEILEPVCSALAAAHAAGVIHRDFKASNISVGDEGGRLVVKLLDFGIAKLVQPDGTAGLTVVGTRLGTPHAMAPEQIRGEPVDERADIYALGVLVHQMLTGSYPFRAPTAPELERMHLTARPPRPSAFAPVPAALDAVVARCLEKDPGARYRSVGDFLAALRQAVAGDPARSDAPERDAVALHVELPQSEDADEEEQASLIEDAEQALRQAGYQLALQTGNTILGVRLVSDDSGENRAARRHGLALARGLARKGLKVALHAGRAKVSSPAEGSAVNGGEILQVAAWELVVERDGVRLTSQGAADLD